jgi:hypothetical protein
LDLRLPLFLRLSPNFLQFEKLPVLQQIPHLVIHHASPLSFDGSFRILPAIQ